MPSAYQSLGRSLGGAIATGYQAQAKGLERRASNQLYADRSQRRSNLFNVLYQAIGVGSNLYDTYSQNQEGIDYATDFKSGYNLTSGWLENLFGSPEFEKDGTKFSLAEVMARKTLGVDLDEFSRKIEKIAEIDFESALDGIKINEREV